MKCVYLPKFGVVGLSSAGNANDASSGPSPIPSGQAGTGLAVLSPGTMARLPSSEQN